MSKHTEPHADGGRQGRDPRTISAAEWPEIGVERISRGAAIRAKCLDCVGESPAEVRRCADIKCALWPFRMGTDPFRDKREMTEDERIRAAARLQAARDARQQRSV